MSENRRKSGDSTNSQISLNTARGRMASANECDNINSSIVEQVEEAVIESITVRTSSKKLC